MFVGGRSRWGRGTLTHWDVYARVRTHTLVLRSTVLFSPAQNMTHFPHRCAGSALSQCASPAPPPEQASWILPGLFPRASPTAAELVILWGLRGGWEETAGSGRPQGFPGAQGPTQIAVDWVCRLRLPLWPREKERVPDRGCILRSGQIPLHTRLQMGTKGSPARAEQIVFGLWLLPDGPPALAQASAKSWLSLRTRRCC